MSEEKQEKIVYIITHGTDYPELITLPFVLAVGAMAMDVEAVVALQGPAVQIALKGGADHVYAPNMKPLKDLMQDFFDLGGKLMVCTPCVQARSIKEEELIEHAEFMAAATLTDEILSANATMTY